MEPDVPPFPQAKRTQNSGNGVSEGSPAPVILLISPSPPGSQWAHGRGRSLLAMELWFAFQNVLLRGEEGFSQTKRRKKLDQVP